MLKPEHPTVARTRNAHETRQRNRPPAKPSIRVRPGEPDYRRAVSTGERFHLGRALSRAGLNLRDEAKHTGSVGGDAIGDAIDDVGAGNFGGIVNFGLVVVGGILGLVLLNLLVGDRGSTIVSKSLRWTGNIIGRLVSPTDPLVSLGHSNAGSPSTTTPSPTPPATTSVAPGGVANVAAPTGRLVPVPGSGHTIDAAYAQLVGYITRTFGVSLSSGYRTNAQNAAAGGAEHSDHKVGAAGDFTGSDAALDRLYAWAVKRFPYVESRQQTVAAGEGAHVHISFFRPSTPHPGTN